MQDLKQSNRANLLRILALGGISTPRCTRASRLATPMPADVREKVGGRPDPTAPRHCLLIS